MIAIVIWRDRKAMVARGRRMLEAQRRGLVSAHALAIWFDRTLPQYARLDYAHVGARADVYAEAKCFWIDCERLEQKERVR